MPPIFGRYQSGIEAATGNLVPAYGKMAEQTANALTGFGQNIAAGIERYSKNRDESEMIDQEAQGIGEQLKQYAITFGSNDEYKPFTEQLNQYVDKLSKIPEMSLAQKRGALNGAKVAFSNIGNQLQMFNMMKDENIKRLTAEGLASAPTSEKVIEDFSVNAGRTGINSAEPISVQRGKFIEQLTRDAEGMPEAKVDISQALKNWDAGARLSLKQAESAGNPTATVMLEQLDALAKRREGEQYRANLAEGQTTDDAMYNMGRGTESITAPSAEALMNMRGTTPSSAPVGLDTALNNQINKLKITAATETNKQLATDIARYDEEIKQILKSGVKPSITDVDIDPRSALISGTIPAFAPMINAVGIATGKLQQPITQESAKAVAEKRVKAIESLNSQKQAAIQSIEDNKKELQQLQGTPTGEAKPAFSVALPKLTVGTQEKEYAVSEEKTKSYVRDWVTQNMGITQTVTNPDGTTRTVKVTPSNFDSIYKTLRPSPQVIQVGGYDLMENKDGTFTKLGESGKAPTRKEQREAMEATFGNIPKNEQEASVAQQYNGLVPEQIETLDFANPKNEAGTTGSGIYLVGSYRGKNYDEFRKNAVGLVQAKAGLEELKRISNKPAESLSFDDTNRAKKIQTYIMADMKTDIVGTQVTEEEWKRLEQYISDPTKIFTVEGAERRGYDVVLMKLNSAIANLGKGTGITVIDSSKMASRGDIIVQKKIEKRTSPTK